MGSLHWQTSYGMYLCIRAPVERNEELVSGQLKSIVFRISSTHMRFLFSQVQVPGLAWEPLACIVCGQCLCLV